MRTVHLIFILLLMMPLHTAAAPRPVPRSPYLPMIYRYADTLLQHGRDTYGPQKTQLLLSALDRTTLKPLHDLTIANPQHDQNLLRLLYTLSELSGRPIYREAADTELKWFLQNPTSQDAPFPPWDQNLAWNVVTDTPHDQPQATPARQPYRPWLLWDRCFELEPQASQRLVLALGQPPAGSPPSPRRIGFCIRAFAVAYQHTKDDAFLNALDAALAKLQQIRRASDAPAPAWLSAAIDCAGAATRVPEPLAGRLRSFAAAEDQAFCDLPHDLKGERGFALSSRQPAESPDSPFTPHWHAAHDSHTTAMVAMMCVSRYENTANIRYRDLIHAAADLYRDALPPDNADPWPMTFGHAITLQLAAWRSTARQDYLDRAIQLADLAVETFWADNPLPRAGRKDNHYHTLTGMDTLALSLVELHLSILHITAVRHPPNTIDR